MTAVSRNFRFYVLNDIFDKCNNTYDRTIKMKLIEVKPDCSAEHSVKSDEKDPKFQIRGHVRISKYSNIFAK